MGARSNGAGAFASLAPRLLARKGGARPAMRAGPKNDLDSLAVAQAELGWDDHGELPRPEQASSESATDIIEARESPEGPPHAARSQPACRRTLRVVPASPHARSATGKAGQPARALGAAAPGAESHRAAFTLRLDPDRHLRLRLASTMQGRSAQMLVTEALDRLLDEIPQLDAIVAKCGQHPGKA